MVFQHILGGSAIMKNGLLKLFALFLGACLVISCSSNTQDENTGVGVVAGAVLGGLTGSLIGQGAGQVAAIGVGAIAGGILGGYVGKSMDSSDKAQMNSAMNSTPKHKCKHWKNKKTGVSYNVTPTSDTMSFNGNSNCRGYTATSISNGKSQQTTGTACRQTDGTWQDTKA